MNSSARKRRVVVLIDMDCFYVQVEQRERVELKGQPCAVVQYNQWQGGGIIAVSYEARANGVKRQMRGEEAKRLCPNIHLLPVPCVREKADLTKYRDAGSEVIDAIRSTVSGCTIERASIDEAYVDVSGVVAERYEQLVAGGKAKDGQLWRSVMSETYVLHQSLRRPERQSRAETSNHQLIPATDNQPSTAVAVVRNASMDISHGNSLMGNVSLRQNDAMAAAEDVLATIKDALTVNGEIIKKSESGVSAELVGSSEWMSSVESDRELVGLLLAADMVREIRAAVYSATGFTCSAGIAANKMLAKLACGLHKPNQQTALHSSYVPTLFQDTPISKVRNLGGKLGDDIQHNLHIQHMSQLAGCHMQQLRTLYGSKTAEWLRDMSTGIDREPVVDRLLSQSIGCGKNFPGAQALDTDDKVRYWVSQLAQELAERVRADTGRNNRKPCQLSIGVKLGSQQMSRQCQLATEFTVNRIVDTVTQLLRSLPLQQNGGRSSSSGGSRAPIHALSMSATKFVQLPGAAAAHSSSAAAGRIDRYLTAAGRSAGPASTSSGDPAVDGEATQVPGTGNVERPTSGDMTSSHLPTSQPQVRGAFQSAQQPQPQPPASSRDEGSRPKYVTLQRSDISADVLEELPAQLRREVRQYMMGERVRAGGKRRHPAAAAGVRGGGNKITRYFNH